MDLDNQDGTGILVVDALFEHTPEQATEILTQPYRDGYHIHRALEWPTGLRVLFVRNKQPTSAKPNDTEAAVAFVRDHPGLTVEKTIAGLAEIGITRGRDWINRTKKTT